MMASRDLRCLVAGGMVLVLIALLQGCGGGGSGDGPSPSPPSSPTASPTPDPDAVTTTVTTTTTRKPLVKWSASCSAHSACAGSGNCCPGDDGKFQSCCDKVDSNVVLEKFRGFAYTSVPSKVKEQPVCDDFMAPWSEPLWGPSLRDDLQIMKDMGATAVRTYGIGAHLDHSKFLDHASKVGLKVIPGFADYTYLKTGSACNIEKVVHLLSECFRSNNYDCHDAVKSHYTEMLKKGYTVVRDDGSRRYHPAISIITIINECELKVFGGYPPSGHGSMHAKVVASALDGLLAAEDDLNIVGPKPALTATVSYATCPDCKATNKFPGTNAGSPGLTWLADYFLAFQNPQAFVGYDAKHDLMHVYQTRWVNSFNMQRPATALCDAESMVLKAYKTTAMSNVPIFIGEYHDWSSAVDVVRTNVKMLSQIMQDGLDTCEKGSNNLVGYNFFEFQVSYWKGGGFGVNQEWYGVWGLGPQSLGKTHADPDSIGHSQFDVFCLVPRQAHGIDGSAARREQTIAQAVIDGWNGSWPTMSVCKATTRNDQELVAI